MKNLRLILQITLPILVLSGAAWVAKMIVDSKELPVPKVHEQTIPTVRVITTESKPVRLSVNALGTVEPRTETQLISEVSGQVQFLSPALASGGFFEEGELLLEVESVDYVAAVEDARAAVARAEAALEREQADAEIAKRDWENIGEGREATPLVLHVPQLKEAQANLASSTARFQMAKRDVERTKIRAPYAGRVRKRMIDVGQFVSRGTSLASVFAIDFAEIRLPIPDEMLPLLELNIHSELTSPNAGPTVTLSAEFAGELRNWSGRVERIEGAIDARTQSVILVARVDDPYGRESEVMRLPLPAGLYVNATISGRFLDSAVVIPRKAIRPGGTIYVLDKEDQLEIREIALIPSSNDEMVVSSGLVASERVITSPLELPVPGMKLRVEDEAR